MKKKLAILGAGRIGQVHAKAIAGNETAELAAVFDPLHEAALAVTERFGGKIADIDTIVNDATIDAVILCTPTDMHADQIELFAQNGKAIFCEKPIDLDAARVRACLTIVQQTNATLMVGFNRRYDAHFMALKAAIANGQIGRPEMGVITSRDPAAPPAEYIRRSGGIFRDMMIHDIDMAVFLMGDLPETVMATGGVLTDPEIAQLDDYDSATAILKWADGRQVSISNSRRAVYGYDQRIEIHGSEGMVQANNERPVNIETATVQGYQRAPLHDFFMTRYVGAYANEIDAFIHAISNGDTTIPSGRDGLNALLIADGALESAKTGKAVPLIFD